MFSWDDDEGVNISLHREPKVKKQSSNWKDGLILN